MNDRMSFDIKRCSRSSIVWYLYFIMRKGSTQKAETETCCHQSPLSVFSLSTPRVLPLSESVCRKQPLAVRVNSDSAAMRYAGALLLTRNAHFNPAQSDSGTAIDVGRQLLCHHYDCVVAHRQQQQQQQQAQAATASSDRLTLAD